jgi:TonB family protein
MEVAELLTHLEGNVVDGQFRLIRRLGGEGASAIYLAEADGGSPQKVAIKLLAADAPDAEARLAGWYRAAQLSHPNLIRVFETGHCQLDGGQFVYEASEFADEVLAEILPARSLTADEARAMLAPVLDVLEFLRTEGYAHGRLKSSNVLVVNDTLKLSADCVPLGSGERVVRLGVYDAPELARGEVTSAVDAWSLGMTLVAALTQRPPEWVRQSGDDPVVPSEIPVPFAGIARSCLYVNPAERSTLRQIKAILDPEPPAQVLGSAAQVPESAVHETPSPAPESEPSAETPRMVIPATALEAIEPARRSSGAGSLKSSLIVAAVVAVVAFAALMVRETEFSHRSDALQNPSASSAPQNSQPTPVAPSPNIAPQTAARNVKPAAGSLANSFGGTSTGVVKRVMPDVLEAAQRSIRGHVQVSVRVMVDAAGDVTSAALQEPSKSSYFNRIALAAAQQWKFARRPAGGTWNVQFEFRQDGIDAGATSE